MKNYQLITAGLLSLAMILGLNSAASAQKKQETPTQQEPKKDTTKKKSGTRMAISNQGIPTKKSTLNNNKSANPKPNSDPNKEETKK